MPDIETFLAPLARLTTRFPDVEGAVIWGDGEGWQAQDDTTELLDAEEIALYAEGLLAEGFGMIWQAVADSDSPRHPDHVLLFFWQGHEPNPPPDPGEGWLILAHGTMPATPSPTQGDPP